MLSLNQPLLFPIFLFVLCIFASVHISLAHNSRDVRRRTLMGIKETPNGGNVTFDCSPSGPCIPCSRSEKTNEKYRCGETGYRIRLKCVPVGSGSEEAKGMKEKKTRSVIESTDLGVNDAEEIISKTRQRTLLGDTSKSEAGSRGYTTYRSCIPAVNEEKISVLGFEALMMALLLSSGSFIYFRRKRSSGVAVATGLVRLPTNSRF